MSTSPEERISFLSLQLERHNRLYYQEARPEIDDRSFDAMLAELQELEAAYPLFRSPNSPTLRVGGAPLQGFRTVKHALPMISLSNSYGEEDLRDFDTRTRKLLENRDFSYVVEPKIDGVALSLRYESGQLVVGITRGDGRQGDDISANVRTIGSIPIQLAGSSIPKTLELRGEVYLPRKKFEALNRQRDEAGLAVFANPRNAAAGSLKLLDSREVARRPLDAIFYAAGELEGWEAETHLELLEGIAQFGFRSNARHWHCQDIDEALAAIHELEQIKAEFDFDIDGAVVKVNERKLYEQLGSTAKSPRWAMAYKYAPEQAETTLQAISIQIGRTGVLTPVAELEPVLISGSTVSRATLHNEEEIHRKDIRVGDRVVIEKAGEIIPAIVRVNTAARSGNERVFAMPKTCPVCEVEVVQREGEVAIRCVNLQCPALLRSWLRHWASRRAMDIDGLGSALVETLVDQKLLNSPADLYNLKAEDVAGLERMGQKSAANLIAGIDKSRSNDLWRLIHALGIPQIGERSAQQLESEFASLEELKAASLERLEAIPDIGPIVAASIQNYFANPANRAFIERLEGAAVNTSRPEAASSSANDSELAGKVFVITGSFDGHSRNELADILRGHGARVSGSVSAKTDFLLAGEKAGSKLKKANNLGVRILSEDAVPDLLKGKLPQ